MSRTYQNPIISGFYPDPSICRVGEDYYLITSTFEFFPGLPIFHSRDLVNWRQIGHVLDRPSQLPLDGIRPSGGLYAPTIRHHDGTFYVINTLVDGLDKRGTLLLRQLIPRALGQNPIGWMMHQGLILRCCLMMTVVPGIAAMAIMPILRLMGTRKFGCKSLICKRCS